jgi:hypothetical protein
LLQRPQGTWFLYVKGALNRLFYEDVFSILNKLIAMKIVLRVVILGLFAALSVSACQENSNKLNVTKEADSQELTKEETDLLREQLLCRNWVFSKIVQTNNLEDDRLDVFRPILDAAFEKASFDFRQNGRFIFSLAGETEKGVWRLNREENRILAIEDETGDERIFTLVEVAQDKLVLSLGDEEVTILLVPQAKP